MTFKVFSLGCKVNSYECSALASMLLKKGYTEDKVNPDVFIINTCSVTSTADQKSRQHIRKFIKEYPNAISVVMGCYSQGNYEYIASEIKPNILIGTSFRDEIPSLIDEYLKTKKNIIKIDKDTRNYDYEEFGITSYTENVRAYLKIQDGCDNFCTYCIVPYRRGKMRSRKLEYILEEANHLVKQGYKEIVLSGIHVGGYGKDNKECSFSDLVEKLSDIEGLLSLRISSIEESEIDDKLINLIINKDNIAKHLHIPLQSGSNNILRRMNRKYTREEFIQKIIDIKNRIKDIAITTDIIVGFPGETEEDFLDTYSLAETCFDQIHVFPYSPREGTVAATFKDQIPPNVKNERSKRLLDLSKEKYEKHCFKYINQDLKVLIEKYDSKNDINYGRTSNYIELAIPNLKGSKIGEYLTINIKKSMIKSY